MKARYSNGNIFVQFSDGDFVFFECTKEKALQVVEMIEKGYSKETILETLDPSYERLKLEIEQIKNENQKKEVVVNSILKDDRFYFHEGKLYHTGIPLSIPMALAEKIQSEIEAGNTEQVDRLSKFWAWCSLMRTSEVRESFYRFIQKNNLIITKQGFVIGFRRAFRKESNPGLGEFVTKEYNRLKKNKKGVNINVYQLDNGYSLTEGIVVGNLKELYLNGSFKDTFESAHRGIHGKTNYTIGKETRLPDNKVDWDPHNECSSGLHGHLGNYNDYSYGNVRFYFVVNPMDVAAAPYDDGSKFRMAALTPLGVMGEYENIEDFVLTEEMELIVEKTMQDHLNRLDNEKILQLEDDLPHTLIQELPLLDYNGFLKSIKQTVNPEIVKKRYNKL